MNHSDVALGHRVLNRISVCPTPTETPTRHYSTRGRPFNASSALRHVSDSLVSDVTSEAARQVIEALFAGERDACRPAMMHLYRFDELA
jgi:hypothetical protein